MKLIPTFAGALLSFVTSLAAPLDDPRIERVPENGRQPDALVDATGRLHVIYLTGEPQAADIHYLTRSGPSEPWSKPLRVNSQPGSAIAVGTVRGPRLALGLGHRVRVVWNGSSEASPRPAESTPLLFARLDDTATGFEPQRNVGGELRHLDGGAALASNGRGTLLAVWHAAPPPGASETDGETNRGVFVATSLDDGRTFASPRRIDSPGLGVCACCGLEASFRDPETFVVLYRSAEHGSERGLVQLTSTDAGRTFQSRRVDRWTLQECPMTTLRITPAAAFATWPSRGVIQFLRLDAPGDQVPMAISDSGGQANHPVAAAGPDQQILVAWTEGTGWQRGGELAWRWVDTQGRPNGPIHRAPGVPVWGFPTAVREADDRLTILY